MRLRLHEHTYYRISVEISVENPYRSPLKLNSVVHYLDVGGILDWHDMSITFSVSVVQKGKYCIKYFKISTSFTICEEA